MPMTDQQLAAFLGFKPTDPPGTVAAVIAAMSPAKRALMEKMRQIEVSDASGGLIPMPEGVIACGPKQIRHHKGNDE